MELALHEPKVLIHYPKGTRKYRIPEKFHGIGHAISRGDETSVVKAVMTNCSSQVLKTISQKINAECAAIISNSQSLFKRVDDDALLTWSVTEQEEELKSCAPTLFNSIQAAAVNKAALDKATVKSYETILPGIMTAVGSLLYCRSSQANAHAMITAITLRRGGANSVSYTRLNHRGLCVSYDTLIRKQDKLAENHDVEVLAWGKQVAEEHANDTDPEERHPGLQVNGDNLDFILNARQSTTKYQGSEYHMFNALAIKNRISSWHLPDNVPIGDHETIPTKEFLPSVEDDRLMRHEMGVICGRVIAEHVPPLAFFKEHIPEHIPHKYSAQASKKSEVIPLGVIMQNENTTEGMEAIVKHLHKYTPGHDDPEKLVTIVSSGDLLTCERESSTIENVRDEKTSTGRLEGLQPHIADFHTSGNYMQAIWDALWDSSCPGDHGALYPAKTRTKAKKVTSDPMKSYNASEELLKTYTNSLIVAAALEYMGMDEVSAEPTRNIKPVGKDEGTYVKTTLTKFVNSFVVPSMEDSVESLEHKFLCHICPKGRPFVTLKGLKRHLTRQHPGQPRMPQQSQATDDHKRNYCTNAMSMCLVALNFTDARKHADGARLLRLYKFLLLYFMAAGKSKYALQSFRLLAAIKCFLTPRLSHELMWCRFVNNVGRPDSNIEPDRECEHDNRNQKDHVKAFHGKITEQSVHRISRSAHKIKRILDNHDRQCNVKKESGKHKDKEEERRKDVVDLAHHFHKEKLFMFQPGRRFRGFPSFPRNYLAAHVDTLQLQVWMKDTLRKLGRTNMFQSSKPSI